MFNYCKHIYVGSSEDERRDFTFQPQVFCGLYPFNGHQSSEMKRRETKVTEEGLEEMRTKIDVSATF